MSTTINTPTPRCVLCCPRWAVLIQAILTFLSVSSTLFNMRFSVTRKSKCRYAFPGRLGARRSALLAIGFYLGSDALRRYTQLDLATSFAENHHYPRGRRLVLYNAEGDFDRNFDWWKESGQASSCGASTAIRKRPQRSAHGQRQQLATSRTSTCLLPFSSMLSTRLTGTCLACSSRRRWKHC